MEWLELIHGFLALAACFVSLAYCIGALFDENTKIAPVLIISAILVFSFIFGSIKSDNAHWEYSNEPYKIERIAALNDNNLMHGRFYLRSGYIDEDLYYQYIIKSGSGFNTSRVKASDATLYYDADNYRVEWYKAEKGWLYFRESKSYAKIYIPEGSISNDYTVDLE